MKRFQVACTFALVSVLTATTAEAKRRPSELVADGNRLFSEKKYDKAELLYKDAQKLLPESPEINFDLGNVAYRKADYDVAEEHYNKAAESPDASRELRRKALYNLGNCSFMRGEKVLDSDLQKALDSYRSSILRYQDVIARDEYDKLSHREKGVKPDEDARFNIEVARLRIKDILDKLKQQEEKRKEQQKQQEEFIKKLKEAIEKEQEIIGETGDAENHKQQGQDVSESLDEIKKKQADNKKATNELAQQLQGQIETARSAASGQGTPPIDQKVVEAQNSLKEAEIEEGTALQHLDGQALTEARGREEAALKNLQEALDKLTKPQPQGGEQQQTEEQQKAQQETSKEENQDQTAEDRKKQGEKDEKMTPEEAQEELAKLRKQASEARKENREEFLRRRPDYQQRRREYEPVDKDW